MKSGAAPHDLGSANFNPTSLKEAFSPRCARNQVAVLQQLKGGGGGVKGRTNNSVHMISARFGREVPTLCQQAKSQTPSQSRFPAFEHVMTSKPSSESSWWLVWCSDSGGLLETKGDGIEVALLMKLDEFEFSFLVSLLISFADHVVHFRAVTNNEHACRSTRYSRTSTHAGPRDR